MVVITVQFMSLYMEGIAECLPHGRHFIFVNLFALYYYQDFVFVLLASSHLSHNYTHSASRTLFLLHAVSPSFATTLLNPDYSTLSQGPLTNTGPLRKLCNRAPSLLIGLFPLPQWALSRPPSFWRFTNGCCLPPHFHLLGTSTFSSQRPAPLPLADPISVT